MKDAWMHMAFQVPLDRFTLDIDVELTAHVTGIFGPSGSGKTTLLETVAGLRKGAQGLLSFDGISWLDSRQRCFVKPERREIGYVPQEHLLFPHWNVRQNLLAGSRRIDESRVDIKNTLERVSELLELSSLLDRQVGTLSGGERQRVALGRALCSGPKLLLLDEPLSSLDGKLRHRILPFLQRVREEFETPILIVSHQPFELQALCDDVLAIQAGKVVTRGRPVDVFTHAGVYNASEDGGFENILKAYVVDNQFGISRIRLGEHGEGPEMLEPSSELRLKGPVTLGLRACDILIALKTPEGLSARNNLSAQIGKLELVGDRVIMTALLEGAYHLPPIAVELTKLAVNELKLESGMTVQLVFKSTSIRVYG